ncbi:MAG: PEP-CTERM sorting domain-containing protein [Phycisphaerae bacterium]
MKRSIQVILSSAVFAAGAMAGIGNSQAATISLVNATTTNSTLKETVAVPMGGTSSTVGTAGYGQSGYIMFGTVVPSTVTYGFTETGTAPTADDVNYSFNSGNIATLQSLPSWLTTTTSSGTVGNISMDPSLASSNYFVAAAYGYPAIHISGQPYAGSYPVANNYANTGDAIQTGEGGENGTTAGTLYKLFDISLGTGTPSSFKLGVIAPQGYDALSQLQVSDGSDSYSVNIDPNQNLGFYFFNVTGAQAGDTIVVSAAASPSVTGYFTHNPYGTSTDLVGMTFDANATQTPEPASMGLLGLGGAAALMLARRRLGGRTSA